ncbi:LamG domain-containing protein [Leptolyngbya sp. FACHB-261]|uniref:LamG domain-containing protein n=1 Tax=Leptolyngbya sp. FACHB-261 TaxID=2692806 RepID=UPI001688D5FF|nr:LamG domain-containing protein [Leptolyngbya sp. FACHB-261]MBD2100271.1 LamG domain-containing protein [Leptolyngbya sp. FACHB-261]
MQVHELPPKEKASAGDLIPIEDEATGVLHHIRKEFLGGSGGGVDFEAIRQDYKAQVLLDYPDYYFRLSETDGMVALDSSGYDRHGAYENVTLGVPGLLDTDDDGAASFNGVDSRIVVPRFYNREDATIEAWVQLKAPSVQGSIVHLGARIDGYGFGVGNGSNYDQAGDYFTGISEYVDWLPTYQPLGQTKHHVVITRQFEDFFLYLDGRCVFKRTLRYIPPTGPILIGAGPGVRHLKAVIDEVAIYSTALPANRINAHYKAGKGL